MDCRARVLSPADISTLELGVFFFARRDSRLLSLQTGFGAHPASYSKSIQGLNSQGVKLNTHLRLARVKNAWICTSTPYALIP